MEELKPFYGLFRGVIIENSDPENKGRVQVGVFLSGKRFDRWATLCVPNLIDYESIASRMPIGSNVWVEYENGDANKPVVLGLFR